MDEQQEWPVNISAILGTGDSPSVAINGMLVLKILLEILWVNYTSAISMWPDQMLKQLSCRDEHARFITITIFALSTGQSVLTHHSDRTWHHW